MKLYINKGQYGWYTTAKNRNDKEDKAYVNLFFPKNTDPADGTEEIDAIEWRLTCYKGKVGMTIFKYNVNNKDETGKFGNPNVTIDSDSLPFY